LTRGSQACHIPTSSWFGSAIQQEEDFIVLESVNVTLRTWDRRGGTIQPSEFLERLSFDQGYPLVEEGAGCPRVQLLALSEEDFAGVDTTEDAGAQSEAFSAAIRDGLIRAADWLTSQPQDVFEKLRASGRITDVFIGGWISDDQFDLDVPPEFLRACGDLGLTVSICTND
jgi:hypothetical protein